jgi:membrane-associated phospholipid phosphatase
MSPCRDSRHLLCLIVQRIRRHTLLKAVGTMVFMAVFFYGYFTLLKNPVFPVTEMPLTIVDQMVSFQPQALVFYLSLWFYVSLPPALLETRNQLVAYGLAIGGMCLAGLACFLLWPTAVPSFAIDAQANPGFLLLKGVDAGGNAFPSLHVATACFSGVWLDRQLRELGSGPGTRIFNGLWCAAIVYSTLATKQHVSLDVVGGVALAIVTLLFFSPSRRAAA